MVEWKKLTSVSNIQYGFPFDSSLFTEDKSYIPLIRIRDIKPAKASTYFSGDYLNDYIIKKGDILVGMDGEFNLEKWNDRDGLLNQRVLKISGKQEICLNGYIYHYMGPIFKEIEKKTAGGSVKHLSAKVINTIQIPIPSKPEQERIVKILDTFTDSIANLKALIDARRKQYEYYRNQLLNLEGKEGVEWKKLGEIMRIVRGASPRPISKYITTDEDGVNWIKIGDVSANDKYITCTKEKITKAGAQKSRYLKPGDFVLSNSMSFGRPYILKTDGCIHDGWIAMSDFDNYVTTGYLYEVLSAPYVQNYWGMKANNGGAMTNLNSDIVKETLIPIPSKEEQSRIVSILDQFEAIIANLEAQLKAREKQYEYYRNKLLTFD